MISLFDDQEQDAPKLERVSVLLPLPLAGAYDYLAPEEWQLEPGDLVEVPLGQRRLIGAVVGPGGDEVEAKKLREVVHRIEHVALPKGIIRFVQWVASWTLSPPGSVLRMAMSVPSALEPPKRDTLFAWRDPEALEERPRLTPARKRVLDLLSDGPALDANDLAREAAVGRSVIKEMARIGLLEVHEVVRSSPFARPDPSRPGPKLTPQQAEAAESLKEKVEQAVFSVTLVDGVTGSGKTEVYFEAIAEALKAERQVLILLPEIALSAEWLDRFAKRFGERPAVWHSDLKSRVRRETWRAIASGDVRVLVGARSALFLPFHALGLIVVDEEHENAYKQEDGVSYHARDMAVVRARIEGFPVALVSATPSLETVENVRAGRYDSVKLEARPGTATLPEVELVDLRVQKPERGSFLAPSLIEAMTAALEAGEQSMLFLNRRGYSPLTLCRTCGHRLECPNCSAWLVEHRLIQKLQCHHCGLSGPMPEICPNCEDEGSFVASGPGVERLAEEVMRRFPDARHVVASSDTLIGPEKAAEFVRSVQAREVDIIIGTQVVSKGHNFPWLTLVGVVDGDLGLAGGDLRASERTFQMLHQVAGRAGRAEHPGKVMIQTHQPENPVMQALQAEDRDRFLEWISEERQNAALPPFGRLAGIVVSASDPGEADQAAQAVRNAAPHLNGVEVFGPAPAPLALLRGRYRRRLLVKAEKAVNLQRVLEDWIGPMKFRGSVRLSIDVDPYNFN